MPWLAAAGGETVEDAAVISKILQHLGLSSAVPEPLPARSPP
jgi:hypothetical protein